MFLGGALALQMPSVQTALARFAVSKLQKSLDGDLEIGALRIMPFNTVVLDDVSIVDRHPVAEGTDTLARIGHLSATLSLRNLFRKKGLELGKVQIDDAFFQLVSSPDSVYSSNIARIFRLKPNPDAKMSLDSLFNIHRVDIRNARYKMLNTSSTATYRGHGINYADMDITVNAKAHDVSFSGGRCRASVDHLDAKEKCGFELYDASGTCCVGMGKTIVDNLHLVDNGGSDTHFSKVVLSYEDTSAWSDFVNAVDLDVTIAPSCLVLHSLSGYSGGTFWGNHFTADISGGHFKGTVSDFRISDFSFTNPSSDVSGTVNGTCSGIPDTPNMRVDATLSDVGFSVEGLEAALSQMGAKVDLPPLAKGTHFTMNGKLSGLLNDCKGRFALNSNLGSLTADAGVRHLMDQSKETVIHANLATNSFDVGRFLGNEAMGPCDLTARLHAGLGKSGINARVEDLNISRFNLLGYDYSGIGLKGTFDGNVIKADFNSSDPSALISLNTDLDIKKLKGRIGARLENVDLAALGLDKRGGASRLSCTVSAEQGLEEDAPARIFLNDTRLVNDNGTHNLGDIQIEARTAEEGLTLLLNSDCIDIKYFGTSDFAALAKDAKQVTLDTAFPDYFGSGAGGSGSEATLSAVVHDASPLLDYLMPGLKVARGTTANINLESDGRLLGYISTPSISFNGLGAEYMNLALDNKDGLLDLTLNTDRLKINNMSFDNAQFAAEAQGDRARLELTYEGSNLLGRGSELNIEAGLRKDDAGKPEIEVLTLPSWLTVRENVWELSKSRILLSNGDIQVDGFNLQSDSQSIALNGRISGTEHTTMHAILDNLDLGIVDDFMPDGGLKLAGILDGEASIISPLPAEFGLGANLTLDNFELWGRPAGDIHLVSFWDDEAKRINAKLDNTYGEQNVLHAVGSYGVKDSSLGATLTLDGFDTGIAAPMLKSVLSELDGKLYGTIKAQGPLDKLKFESEGVRLSDLRTRIAYTNVLYTLNGTLGLDGNGASFNGIGVKDEYGGLGVLNGRLDFKDLKDFRLDAALDAHKLKAIDIPVKGSSALYGDLSVTGTGRVRGPFDALRIDADLATAGPGNVNVPIPSTSAAASSDLLTFVTPEAGEDAPESLAPTKAPKPSGKLAIHAKMDISSEVTANVEIDKESGHVLTAGGSGSVTMDLDTSKSDLQLKGDYTIHRGKYLFNIPGIVSKEFEIKDGSSLKMVGNIMESTLNIDAVHNVKTSLSTLVADSTSVSTRRNVECGLKIGGKLKNPEVSFNINVPDLEPGSKMQVDAALNTNDKIQKQFVALLLFGTFLPAESAGVVNGTNMLFANVGEIVSGQLNNILQKLEIPLDFGFGYQQDNGGTDLFDVAVSTQLFNNRIVVNGSVGNRKYSTSTSAYGDVVGDLDIGYKVLPSGELMIKLFSHSADEYTSSLDYSQRNGVGISYQKEFDSIITQIRQMFMSKRRKAQEALIEAEKKKARKIIHISE